MTRAGTESQARGTRTGRWFGAGPGACAAGLEIPIAEPDPPARLPQCQSVSAARCRRCGSIRHARQAVRCERSSSRPYCDCFRDVGRSCLRHFTHAPARHLELVAQTIEVLENKFEKRHVLLQVRTEVMRVPPQVIDFAALCGIREFILDAAQ